MLLWQPLKLISLKQTLPGELYPVMQAACGCCLKHAHLPQEVQAKLVQQPTCNRQHPMIDGMPGACKIPHTTASAAGRTHRAAAAAN